MHGVAFKGSEPAVSGARAARPFVFRRRLRRLKGRPRVPSFKAIPERRRAQLRGVGRGAGRL